MPHTPPAIELTMGEIIKMLTEDGFNLRSATNAVSRTFEEVGSLLEAHHGTLETMEGMGTKDRLRDSLIVSMSDENVTENPDYLDFDRTNQALSLIENMIANLSRQQKMAIRIGDFFFEFIEHVCHTLTNAEASMLAKMEEETEFIDEEDERLSKQELDDFRASLVDIFPRFKITLLS